jgi:hypothetical protein
MLGDGHVRFGGRARETGQPKGCNRALVRPNTQCQALDRTQPSLPMTRGRAGTMTHDYKRKAPPTCSPR